MFRTTRVLWVVNNALAKVCFQFGERDKSLPGVIIAKEEIADSADHFMAGELSFVQEVDVYRDRPIKEAAFLILLETASAWKMVNNERYANYCLGAALLIGGKYYQSDELVEHLNKTYNSNLESRERSKSRLEKIENDFRSLV